MDEIYETDQTDETNQINEIDDMDQTDHIDQTNEIDEINQKSDSFQQRYIIRNQEVIPQRVKQKKNITSLPKKETSC